MKGFSIKKIIFSFIIITLLVPFSIHSVYASEVYLEGYVQEVMDMDVNNNITAKDNIEGIRVHLINAESEPEQEVAVSVTDSDGKYSFSSIQNLSKYKIKVNYPDVEYDEIDNIDNVETAKNIQNKLKYNAQDYLINYNKIADIKKEETYGTAQVVLVIDNSSSMRYNSDPKLRTQPPTRIQKAKEVSKRIVDAFCDNDIYVSIVTYSSNATVLAPASKNKEELFKKIETMSPNGSTYTGKGLKLGIDQLDPSYSNRFVFLLTELF